MLPNSAYSRSPQKPTSNRFLLLILSSLFLSACGGGGSGSSQLIGQFIDDPVGGLAYSCSGSGSSQAMTGTTDADGHFNYLGGQACTFSVGKVTLGTLANVPSDGKVTPQDVAGVTRSATSAPSAVAIAQFLQSLNDGSASGKIVIPAATQTALNASSVQAVTLVSRTGAVSQTDLQTIVSSIGKNLVSATTAAAALNTQITQGVISTTAGAVSASAPVALNSIVVTSTVPSNAAGLSEQMSAVGYYSDGSHTDVSSSVTWSSSDTTALTINSNGAATGLKIGSATVTASLKPTGASSAVAGTVLQTTTAALLTSISITHANSLPAGLTDQLTATGTYTDGSTQDLSSAVTWSSSDNNVLTVTRNGLVTGLVKGKAMVIANISGISPANYEETVLDPTPVNLAISFVQGGLTSIYSTTSTALRAILKFSNNTLQTVSDLVNWNVNPSSGATVIENTSTGSATLTSNNAGSVAISATYNNIASNSLPLTVAALPQAQFIDDPVIGLGYSCVNSTQTTTGTTDSQGMFNYIPGQSCTFKVGNVTLGTLASVPSDGKVTPQDVAGVVRSATSTPTAVTIAQFLQSLNDGSVTGKIVIPSNAATAFGAVNPVTLTSSSGAISATDLQALVTLAGKTMVSSATATSALNAQISQGNVSASTGAVGPNTAAVLNSIAVSSTAQNNPAGLSEQFTATGYYTNGSTANLSSLVTWSSSDSSKLSINASGLATGVKKGNVTVAASYTPTGSNTAVTGSAVQTTSDPILQSVSITHANSLPAGLTDQLTATGTYTDGSTQDLSSSVAWSSSDSNVLTVSSNGLVTGLVKGTATVTAIASGSIPLTATYTETVIDPNPLSLLIAFVQSGITSIQNTASTFLQAVMKFTDQSTQLVSSLASYAVGSISGDAAGTVTAGASSTSNATLTGTKPGTISIIASYLGLSSNSLSLSVTALPPTVQSTSVTLNVIGVNPSTVSGSINATDPQGYPLNYSIQANGVVGQASVDSGSGAFSYTVAGNTQATSDTFKVLVSNGKTTSLATVAVTLNTDPLLQNQWHIQNLGVTSFASVLPTSGNDMNVAGAWALGYTGKGVKVAVVDTGLEIAHADLAANVDVANSRNLLTGTTNPTPTVTGEDHGTQVAGIIGSVAFNGKGGRGVAYGATLRGYNLLGSGVSPSILNFGNALGLASYSADNDVFNESFGNSPTNLDPTTNSYDAINNNLLSMRGSKGAILIQSAGNEFVSFNNGTTVCNNANTYGVSCGDPATDTRRDGTLPIIVGAINSDGVKSSYSNTGSAIWVVTPGGEYGYDSQYMPSYSSKVYKPAIVTTALTGCQNAVKGTTKVNTLDAQGQNTYAPQCQYTALMNGTSSAAPNLSGVVALMLQANPNLGYRDVKYILAKTAKKVDANNTGVTTTNLITGSTAPVVLEQGWVKNAAGYWFANAYGFGAVDAAAAVSMAKSYTAYLSAQQSTTLAMHYLANVNVPNGNTTGSTMTFSMSPGFSTIEQVIMVINVTSSPALTCNQIELTSPSGTKSILMHAANGFSNSGVLQRSIPGTRFMSNAFYGEASAGTWTLRFLDYCTSATRTSILSTDTQTLMLTGH